MGSKVLVFATTIVLGAGACDPSDTSSTCYDTVIAAAQSCLPPASATGAFNDAGTICTYSGGDEVTFTPPEFDGVSNFVVDSAGGSLCMSYQSADGGFTLETAAGTTTKSSNGDVTCPNNIAYTGDTPAGNISAYSSSLAFFTLVTADGGLSVFNCSAY
jgi:hypothetical protein